MAGLLTPSSYDRKGAQAFVADRLLRLGVAAEHGAAPVEAAVPLGPVLGRSAYPAFMLQTAVPLALALALRPLALPAEVKVL